MAGTGAQRGIRQNGNSGPRRAQPTGSTAKAVAVMPVELWQRAHRAAEHADLSLSGYLAELVARDEVDPVSGAPLWARARLQDELPGLEMPV